MKNKNLMLALLFLLILSDAAMGAPSNDITDYDRRVAGLTAAGDILTGREIVVWNSVSEDVFNASEVSGYTLRRRVNKGAWSTVQNNTKTQYITNRGADVDDFVEYQLRICTVSYGCGDYFGMNPTSSQFTELRAAAPVRWMPNIREPKSINTSKITAAKMDYEAYVEGNGFAKVDIDFSVPQGRAGHTPQLGLSLSSQKLHREMGSYLRILRGLNLTPQNILGYGWNANGFSRIHACKFGYQDTLYQLIPATEDAVHYGKYAWCLDGVTLIQVSGNGYDEAGTEYRLYDDNFTRVVRRADHFEVYYPSGKTAIFGGTPDSRIEHKQERYGKDGASDIFLRQYSISSYTDRWGNEISYEYRQSEGTERQPPSSNPINYRHHLNGDHSYPLAVRYGDVEISFQYMPSSHYHDNLTWMAHAMVLSNVEVRVAGTLIRDYRIFDDADEVVIQECGYTTAGVLESCATPLKTWLSQKSEPFRGSDGNDHVIVEQLEVFSDALYGGGLHTIFNMTTSSNVLFTEFPFSTAKRENTFKGGYRVSQMRRSDGLGGYNSRKYAYNAHSIQDLPDDLYGWNRLIHIREIDEASGVVTYTQFIDPKSASKQILKEVHRFDGIYGQHNQTLSEDYFNHNVERINHSNGKYTLHYYQSSHVAKVFEKGTLIGASRSTNAPSFSGGFITGALQRIETVAGRGNVTALTLQSSDEFGLQADLGVSNPLQVEEFEVEYENVIEPDHWEIGFEKKEIKSYSNNADDPRDSSKSITNTQYNLLEYGYLSRSQYVGDPNLELNTLLIHDDYGNLTDEYTWSNQGTVASRFNYQVTSMHNNSYPYVMLNALNQSTTFDEYDKRFGVATETSDANGLKLYESYDAFGRLVRMEDNDGNISESDYEKCKSSCKYVESAKVDYVVTTTSDLNPTKIQYYDSLGRVIREDNEAPYGDYWIRTDTIYDKLGRVYKKSIPYHWNGSQNTEISYDIYEYDIRNRVTKIRHAYGGIENIVIDKSASEDSVIFNTTSTVTKQTGATALTLVKSTEVNVLGQVVSSSEGGGSQMGGTTSAFQYDAMGKLIKSRVDGGADGIHITQRRFDNAGNLVWVDDTDAGQSSYTYDAYSRKIESRDALANVITYEYDALDRLKSQSGQEFYEWRWDESDFGIGKIAKEIGPGFTKQFDYTPDSKLDEINTSININAGTGATEVSGRVNYGYDYKGRMNIKSFRATYNGETYDSLGVRISYNGKGFSDALYTIDYRLIKSIPKTNYGEFSKDIKFGNNVRERHTFFAKTNRPKSFSVFDHGPENNQNQYSVVESINYGWLSNGNLYYKTKNSGTYRNETYSYDALNRLDTIRITGMYNSYVGEVEYQYSQLGALKRRTSDMTGYSNFYAYNYTSSKPNRLDRLSDENGFSNLSYYDNGAVHYIDGSQKDTTFEYQDNGKPSRISVSESGEPDIAHSFRYGPNGNRIYWSNGESSIWYLGDIEVRSGPFTDSVRYQLDDSILALQTKNPIGSRDIALNYLHRDYQGTIVASTRQYIAGTFTGGLYGDYERFYYAAFGDRRSGDFRRSLNLSETDELLQKQQYISRRGYIGQEHIDELDMVHLNGRVYFPKYGRFLSPDPYVVAPYFGQSYNRYSYSLNNPLVFSDPSGFATEYETIEVTGTRISGSSSVAGLPILPTFNLSGILSSLNLNMLNDMRNSRPSPEQEIASEALKNELREEVRSDVRSQADAAMKARKAMLAFDKLWMEAAVLIRNDPRSEDGELSVLLYYDGEYLRLSTAMEGKSRSAPAPLKFGDVNDLWSNAYVDTNTYGIPEDSPVAGLIHNHRSSNYFSGIRFSQGGQGSGDLYIAEQYNVNVLMQYRDGVFMLYPIGVDTTVPHAPLKGVELCTSCL